MDNFRVYIVQADITEMFCSEILSCSDEVFAAEAERQGYVWTLRGFADDYSMDCIPYPNCSYMRILNINSITQ